MPALDYAPRMPNRHMLRRKFEMTLPECRHYYIDCGKCGKNFCATCELFECSHATKNVEDFLDTCTHHHCDPDEAQAGWCPLHDSNHVLIVGDD